MIKGIDHIAIYVADLEKYVDFFSNKLELKISRKTSHHGGSVEYVLPKMETIIEIHKTGPLNNPEVNHIAFMTSNINETCNKLESKGVTIESQPHIVEETNRQIANLRFPDGIRFQLVESDTNEKE